MTSKHAAGSFWLRSLCCRLALQFSQNSSSLMSIRNRADSATIPSLRQCTYVSGNIMKIIHSQITAIIVTTILACNNQSNKLNNADLKSDTLVDNHITSQPLDTPRSFVKNYGVNDSNRLFVFVGQKIWVDALPSRTTDFDNGFKAKYLVLEKVFGNFPSDTIEFIAYDHYGIPAFSKYQNVLLYLSANSGTYYQQKYIYNDVYKTKDGRWAGSYAGDDYEHEYNKHTKIKPIIIQFTQKVAYPKKVTDDDGKQFTLTFPKPYFKTVGDSAYAIYGNYIDDLFKLKRDGYLTARNIFKNGKLVQ
ncbi:MAG: hypothetical protein JST02_12425 [Bacteroidetes bacterium]|nr:hypothetical protein [Bacteroidota bacterium]